MSPAQAIFLATLEYKRVPKIRLESSPKFSSNPAIQVFLAKNSVLETLSMHSDAQTCNMNGGLFNFHFPLRSFARVKIFYTQQQSVIRVSKNNSSQSENTYRWGEASC